MTTLIVRIKNTHNGHDIDDEDLKAQVLGILRNYDAEVTVSGAWDAPYVSTISKFTASFVKKLDAETINDIQWERINGDYISCNEPLKKTPERVELSTLKRMQLCTTRSVRRVFYYMKTAIKFIGAFIVVFILMFTLALMITLLYRFLERNR